MKKVELHPLAKRELRKAADRYGEEAPHLKREFLEEVDIAGDFLLDHPRIAQRILGPIRRLVLSRFPYKLVYLPKEDGSIRILAVAHDKRDPDYWVGRR